MERNSFTTKTTKPHWSGGRFSKHKEDAFQKKDFKRKSNFKSDDERSFKDKKTFKKDDAYSKRRSEYDYKKFEPLKFNKTYKRETKRFDSDRICIVAAFHSPTFSGRIGSEVLRALNKLGLKVSASDRLTYLTQKGFSYGTDIEEILKLPACEDVKLWVSPLNELPERMNGDKNYVLTTFNVFNVDTKKLKCLKNAKHVWVPSEKHAAICVKAGVNKLNLSVFNIPVNSAFNKMAVRPAELAKKTGIYRFLVSGSPTFISGIEDVLKAYIVEFKPEEKVELIIKLTHYPNLKKNLSFELGELKKRLGALNNMFAKVTVVAHTLTDEDYSGLIASADTYVTAEKSSNSALGLKEAVACGNAVVAPKWLLDMAKVSGEGVYPVEYLEETLDEGKVYANSSKLKVRKLNCEKLAQAMRKSFNEKKKAKIPDIEDSSKLAIEIREIMKKR